MSKDIWHSADELPPEDSYIVVKLTSGKCEVGFDFEYDFDHIEKWAFFDDLLALEAELERTRKALEIAVDALKYANKCIKGGCVNWETEIDKALEQITALEQKDE